MKKIDQNQLFSSDKLAQDLAPKLFKGGISTMSAKVVQFILSTGGTVVLARLLTPTDYGLFGMVMIIFSFAHMFMISGLSMATIQKANISRAQISTLFWINSGIGAFLGLCFITSSPFVASFFGQPELKSVTAVLSLVFIFGSIKIQHEALLRRHMQFGALAIIIILSEIISLITTIILALSGWRYWALVLGKVISTLSYTLLTFLFLPWIPGKIGRGTGVRSMLRFGGNLTIAGFTRYLTGNFDKLLIGKFLGADSLGIYGKAYRILLLPVSEIRMPMTNLAMPALSALKNEPNRYIKYFQRFLDILATITIPITLYCAIEAEFIISLLLGHQWMAVVPVFRILAIAGIIIPISQTQAIVLLSLGFDNKYLFYYIVNTLITLIAISIGLLFGITGIAIAFVISNYLILIPSMVYCFHGTPITIRLFLKTTIRPILTSCISACIIIIFKKVFHNDSFLFHITLSILYLAVYMTASYIRKSIRETVKMFTTTFSLKSRSVP